MRPRDIEPSRRVACELQPQPIARVAPGSPTLHGETMDYELEQIAAAQSEPEDGYSVDAAGTFEG